MCQDNGNNSEDMRYLKNTIVVNSVVEEYEYISKQHCKCGGCFERTAQAFFPVPVEHDILTVKCMKCGFEMDFVFDISSFYDKYTEEILKNIESKLNTEKDDKE